jgi:Fe2+ transport system protein FeoA
MTLGDVSIGSSVTVIAVAGEAAFRRRLMELGVLPGTRIELVRVAPLGDPMELRVRGCALSIRRDEARSIAVDLLAAELPLRPTSDVTEVVSIGPSVPAAP